MASTFKSFIFKDDQVHPIQIEVQILQGMPDFQIIGLGSKELKESKERSRSAIKNSGYKFPIQRKIINLSPAHLPKTGTHTDLPIILGLLIQSKQIQAPISDDTLILGEASLSGQINPIPNLIPILEAAKNHGIQKVFLPQDNLQEAQLIQELKFYPVQNLKDLIFKLQKPTPASRPKTTLAKNIPNFSYPTFDDIINQQIAKRVLTISLAGYHHLLFIGAPGQGKSLLAESSKNLLPTLTNNQRKSLLNRLPKELVQDQPNFQKLDSSATKTQLHKSQGAFQKCRYGVIVLNELPECQRPILESLKQPLEETPLTFIATMNPCHCGYKNTQNKACYCTDYDLLRYRSKLSGSLLDRFDLSLNILAEPTIQKPQPTANQTIQAYKQIESIRKLQAQRQKPNSQLSLKQLVNPKNFDSKALNLLSVIEAKRKLSTRRILKIAQVARTIADLDGLSKIQEEHLAESLSYQTHV